MKAFLSSVALFLLFVLCLFILEGACFRLVEDYAQKRLEFAWGKPGQGHFHPLLKKLPLDHFNSPPKSSEVSALRVQMEDKYASKIMSFGRPTRDRLREQVERAIDPLDNFEIKDIGKVESIVLPGLQKPATLEEVNRKLARRIADPLEFAKGLVIRVLPHAEKHLIAQEFNRLASSFKFLLERGFACAVMPVSSYLDLLDKTKNLRNENPMIAQNLYLWGDEMGADLILQVTKENASIFKAIIINRPSLVVPPPQVKGMPWVLLGASPNVAQDGEQLANLLLWVDRGRDADRLYPSRLGGLMKFVGKKNEDFESFAVAYLLQVLEFAEQVGKDWPEPKPLLNSIAVDESLSAQEEKPSKLGQSFDLLTVEQKIQKLQHDEKENPVLMATFDCEIVRGYRELHIDDINLRKVSNRDLVLKLGMGFEEMGQEVLQKIGDKDPLFLRFYRSLKEVQETPLN
jgi:hypothetical protein